MVKPADAQSIPSPIVPQFTVKFVNASYPVTTTNSYTGQNQTQLISNNSIEIMIKNQPFVYSNNGVTYQIYFNVRVKPHFSNPDNWTEVYPIENLTSSKADGNGVFPYAWYISLGSPPQSNLDYTTIEFPVVPTNVYGASGYDVQGYVQSYYSGDVGQQGEYMAFLTGVPYSSQLDFQIEALVGHSSTYWYIQHPFTPTYGGYSAPAVAYDSASGWSTTQIVSIGQSSVSPNPTVPEFPSLVVLPLVLTLFLVGVLFRKMRLKSTDN